MGQLNTLTVYYVCPLLQLSLTSKMVQRMSLGWISKTHKRVEFVRMRGPCGKGYAEIAVSRVKGSGPETPDLENFPVDDFDDNQQVRFYLRLETSLDCKDIVAMVIEE